MKKSKYTEEQIAFALRQGETGTRVSEICRKMGISDATYYSGEQVPPTTVRRQNLSDT